MVKTPQFSYPARESEEGTPQGLNNTCAHWVSFQTLCSLICFFFFFLSRMTFFWTLLFAIWHEMSENRITMSQRYQIAGYGITLAVLMCDLVCTTQELLAPQRSLKFGYHYPSICNLTSSFLLGKSCIFIANFSSFSLSSFMSSLMLHFLNTLGKISKILMNIIVYNTRLLVITSCRGTPC